METRWCFSSENAYLNQGSANCGPCGFFDAASGLTARFCISIFRAKTPTIYVYNNIIYIYIYIYIYTYIYIYIADTKLSDCLNTA